MQQPLLQTGDTRKRRSVVPTNGNNSAVSGTSMIGPLPFEKDYRDRCGRERGALSQFSFFMPPNDRNMSKRWEATELSVRNPLQPMRGAYVR